MAGGGSVTGGGSGVGVSLVESSGGGSVDAGTGVVVLVSAELVSGGAVTAEVDTLVVLAAAVLVLALVSSAGAAVPPQPASTPSSSAAMAAMTPVRCMPSSLPGRRCPFAHIRPRSAWIHPRGLLIFLRSGVMSDSSTTADVRRLDPMRLWSSWWESFGARAPLSGNVTQDFDAAVVRTVGSQLGFVNVTAPAAADPQLEKQITEQVASYGRQLGRLMDAVDVLVRRLDRTALTADDDHALDRTGAVACGDRGGESAVGERPGEPAAERGSFATKGPHDQCGDRSPSCAPSWTRPPADRSVAAQISAPAAGAR